MTKAFTFPITLVAICLVIGLALLLQKRLTAWLLASAMASLALLAGALTRALPAVEAESSARPVARALLAERREGEALVSGKFLVRGIIYYTRLPVTIFASKAHPFWADHPLPIIVGAKGMRVFASERPTVLCALRKSDWASLEKEPPFAARDSFADLGEIIIVRAVRPETKPESAKVEAPKAP